jgi:hypothetical protein
LLLFLDGAIKQVIMRERLIGPKLVYGKLGWCM